MLRQIKLLLILSIITFNILSMEEEKDKVNQNQALGVILQSKLKESLDLTNLDKDSKSIIAQFVVNDWQIQKILKGHNKAVDQLSITTDAALLLSCDFDGAAKVWDIEKAIVPFKKSSFYEPWSTTTTDEVVNFFARNNSELDKYLSKKAYSTIFFSPGQRLKLIYCQNGLKRIDFGSIRESSGRPIGFNINYLLFSNNGNYFAYGNNKIMGITHNSIFDQSLSHSAPATLQLNNNRAIVPYQDNNFIIGCENGLFIIIPQISQEEDHTTIIGGALGTFPGRYNIDSLNYEFISDIKAEKLAISNNSKYLAILRNDKKLSIMDLETKKIIENIETNQQINTLNLSYNGQYLAIGLFGTAKLIEQKACASSSNFKYLSNILTKINLSASNFLEYYLNPHNNSKNDCTTANSTPSFKIWDTKLKGSIAHCDLYDNCTSIIFSPNSMNLFLGLANGDIFHLKNLELYKNTDAKHIANN